MSARLGMGCMRLSTEADRDEARALAVIHAALDAGVRFFDTSDAYCLDASETGHNERLLRRALDAWPGDRSGVRVATKGGLVRPRGRWVPDGRARHLAAACEASRRALGVPRIDLYQLHAPDPKVELATSVRALRALQRDGLIESIGLCNVTLGQLEQARDVAEIASVQLELSPFHEAGFRGGVPEFCAAHRIRLIAHRPLGGAAERARLERDPLLRELGERLGATPQQLALAWLLDLHETLLPIPGPTRLESARGLACAAELRLGEREREQLDRRFPAGVLLRVPRERRRPAAGAVGEVVLVMGLGGAGKTTLARGLAERGYLRLNRDEAGGTLAELLPKLEAALRAGERRVVLDNTYLSRHSRNAVVEAAWRHGVPARCVWLTTGIEDAQVNAVQRLLQRHGRLLEPDELKTAARRDPNTFGPSVQFRHQRELEPPLLSEGFAAVDEVAFERRMPAGERRALLFWYDGVLRRSRSGARTPVSPDDVELLPGRAEALRRCHEEGLLLLGLSWHPEVASGAANAARVEACLARTHELLGVPMDALFCPHADGPPACWCRKPLPGLGLLFAARHRLDAARCVYVGDGANDRGFARRLGFQYSDANAFFSERSPR